MQEAIVSEDNLQEHNTAEQLAAIYRVGEFLQHSWRRTRTTRYVAALMSTLSFGAATATPAFADNENPHAEVTQVSPDTVSDPLSIPYGEWQGTGGYPQATEPAGRLDRWGARVRECASYVYWRLNQAGIRDERIGILESSSMDELFNMAQKRGESIDKAPATGAVAVLPRDDGTLKHLMIVERAEVDPATGARRIILSDYNGGGGGAPLNYGIQAINETDVNPSIVYIHFEKDLPANGAFLEATPYKEGTDRLRSGDVLTRNLYIESPDGNYKLLLSKKGNLEFYGPGNRLIWESQTSGKGGTMLKVDKGKHGKPNKLVLLNNKLKPVKSEEGVTASYDIGSATKVLLTDRGMMTAFQNKGKAARKILPTANRKAKTKHTSKR